MEIKNRSHNWQSETKLKRKLHHTMTSYEASGYELAYVEYNLIHYSLCQCVSTCQGTLGDYTKKIIVKEFL